MVKAHGSNPHPPAPSLIKRDGENYFVGSDIHEWDGCKLRLGNFVAFESPSLLLGGGIYG